MQQEKPYKIVLYLNQELPPEELDEAVAEIQGHPQHPAVVEIEALPAGQRGARELAATFD